MGSLQIVGLSQVGFESDNHTQKAVFFFLFKFICHFLWKTTKETKKPKTTNKNKQQTPSPPKPLSFQFN